MHGRTDTTLTAERDGAVRYDLLARLGIVLIVAAIFFWRTPATFIHPQFYGEDAIFFFHARVDGWHVVTMILAGYLTLTQGLVALAASYLSPVLAPAAYVYTSIALTLTVAWLATSPRLDLPYKPLLAIAIVIVPMGREELGSPCDIQWILPIGAFAMMFMRDARSLTVRAGEAIFAALVALTGPFSAFLAPLYLVAAWQAAPAERPRLLVLCAIMAIGGAVQAALIVTHPIPVAPYTSSPAAWITIPFNQIATTFGVYGRPFDGWWGASIGAALILAGVAIAGVRPYRLQKLFILLFGLSIAIGGLYKYREALPSQANAMRYFYIASVFALWFICCMATRRCWFAGLVAAIEIATLPFIGNQPMIPDNLEWANWARFIDVGLPVLIPTPPAGWYVGFKATPSGPLATFAPWLGKNIAGLARIDPSACQGTIGAISEQSGTSVTSNYRVAGASVLWPISGTVSSGVEWIAVTDKVGTVTAFGWTGFQGSRWQAVLTTRPDGPQAFGIVDNGKRACPLS